MKAIRTPKYLYVIFLSFITLYSCLSGSNDSVTETPTSGNIKIGVDESYQLLLDTEIFTFESIYKYGKITPVYSNEVDIIDLFMKDSIRNIIVNRQLTKEEKEYLTSYQINPRTTKIAYDGIAFIVNKENPDTLLNFLQLKRIFTGDNNTWKKINNNSGLGDLKVVFDNSMSGNIRFLMEKFDIRDSLPGYCKAVDNNPEVINYIENNKGGLGIISVNWISDKHDTISQSFLQRIKVIEVSSLIDPESYYKPYQAYIADKSYPFIREVYYISRETFAGLGSGFASFVAGEKGQRIILKSKLVPATMPVRLVQIKNVLILII